ncbi:hypothetical protein HGQ17_04810 [Nesterenkonia sp. MY13]|uniref:Uncharacterized protein n=1 Tax=Nesterenkonia sedimenti TaxID=1463632 RepID=A0A7X8YDM5_9MICC|nr:hypothetical protein [Nesterenkonia sedimenti]NLS09337.1 hypothetical protein [Nesterenkonia sedimenti]
MNLDLPAHEITRIGRWAYVGLAFAWLGVAACTAGFSYLVWSSWNDSVGEGIFFGVLFGAIIIFSAASIYFGGRGVHRWRRSVRPAAKKKPPVREVAGRLQFQGIERSPIGDDRPHWTTYSVAVEVASWEAAPKASADTEKPDFDLNPLDSAAAQWGLFPNRSGSQRRGPKTVANLATIFGPGPDATPGDRIALRWYGKDRGHGCGGVLANLTTGAKCPVTVEDPDSTFG